MFNRKTLGHLDSCYTLPQYHLDIIVFLGMDPINFCYTLSACYKIITSLRYTYFKYSIYDCIILEMPMSLLIMTIP